MLTIEINWNSETSRSPAAMNIAVFQVVIPYNLVQKYRVFWGTLLESSEEFFTLKTETSGNLESLVIRQLTTWRHILQVITFKLKE